MDVMDRLGRLVKTTRTRRGYATQTALAAAMGKSPSFVSRIERGAAKELPPPEDLQVIGSALGLSMRTMLEVTGYLEPVEVNGTPDVITIPVDDPRAELVTLLTGYPALALNVILATVREIAPAIRDNMAPQSDTRTGP
jgi:transcriptional regulator with XRE-family HTH domain